MSRSIVFVTTEFSPQVPGGAGTVVARLRTLLAAGGDRVLVLLVTPHHPGELPPGVIPVLYEPGSDPFLSAADAAAVALAGIAPPDLVEIQDFDGLGFATLRDRAASGVAATPVVVRFHGPGDMQVEAMGVVPPALQAVPVMEAESLRMADAVIVPSAEIGAVAAARYGLDRVVVGPPPLPAIEPVPYHPETPRRLVIIGRLSEVKGSHDAAVTIAPVLAGRDAIVEFVGADGWSATADAPMRAWLRSLLPGDLHDRIRFTDPMAHDQLIAHLDGAAAVVAPSRFDSFNLAVREARLLGLPVVVPDLPAFSGSFDEEHGALVYDGTRVGLASAIERLLDDAALAARLAAAPPPESGDPLAAYATLPSVRHPQSQAGLSTAANHRFEASRRPAASGRMRGVARRALGALPEPAADLAVRIVPQRWKDWFRGYASWPAERERRSRASRRRAVLDAIAAGEYPEISDPAVTVVIPCYDQGEYVEGALLTVFEQTERSFEVVIVDDGSGAGTKEILRTLDWPRTRVVAQENRGLPAARNTGIALARGQYVVTLDADDELRPGYLGALLAAIESEPGAAYAHCWAELFGDVAAVWATRPWNRYQIMVSNSVVGCVLLRKAAWEAAGGYDETMTAGNEDWELWVRLAAAGWGAVQVREPLFRYRKHGISMSVETESRFEQGRHAVVARNRAVYGRLAAIKAEEYPLLSVIVSDADGGADVGIGDVELVAVPGPLRELGHRVRGKYVVDWRGAAAGPGYLDRLVAALEENPGAGFARSEGGGPTVVRRWSVSDPSAPAAPVLVAVAGSGGGTLLPGQFPEPAWMIPDEIGGLPVQRQRPEVDGALPEWATS